MKTALYSLVLAALISAPVVAADNPFVGTWKTNPAKSHVSGRTITYSRTANGFHFASAAGEDYDFAMDGKDYPVEGGEAIAWKSMGEKQWQNTQKQDGKVVSTAQLELSADGNTLTESYSNTLPDGTEAPSKVIRHRLSGGPGLAGTWKTKEATVDADVTTITEPSAGHLRMETPSRKLVIDGPTDGSAFPMPGPYVPKDWVATLKFKNAATLDWSGGFKGKPRVQGVNTVSGDGKTMTSVYWNVGKEKEKFTEVSDRQ